MLFLFFPRRFFATFSKPVSFALVGGALLLLTACTAFKPKSSAVMDEPLFRIPFETNPNQTVTYDEAIACYEKMAKAFPHIFRLKAEGTTDSYYPLHTAVLSTSGDFEANSLRKAGKRILFINNGIHPGEPEGIDATLLLLRDFLTQPERLRLLENTVLVVIPIYNVDGCLRRGSFSRANQNGPEAYGFRGNDRNYDLNRDFIKCDSRNAQTFNQIFSYWRPDVFVDTHTSNGADYPYTMTLIATQHNKLEAPLGEFLQKTMLPDLYARMARRGWEMCPYVDGPGETPDQGLWGFCDYGRFSTGYAAMWNAIGFMPETHMLKPFADRLRSTQAFLEETIAFLHEHGDALAKARAEALERTLNKKEFVLDWRMDRTQRDSFRFKGYAAKYKPSEVSGLPRLYYDRSETWERDIPYYNTFVPALTVTKPWAYLLPQAWENVIGRLRLNKVQMERLSEDVLLEVEMYRIDSFRNRNEWEGHYYHHNVRVMAQKRQHLFRKGDYVVLTNQPANRYIVETLEPHAPDSWFAWNFFDPILMQKEYFSAYVFEDLAADFLRQTPAVRAELEELKKNDPEFAADARKQLDWVYRRSPWYEPTHRLYPVGRVLQPTTLPLVPPDKMQSFDILQPR